MQEGRSVGTESDALVARRLLIRLLHHDFLAAASHILERLVLHLRRHAEVVDEALLLGNLALLLSELIFHLLQLLRQEIVLLAQLFARYGQLLVFFLGVLQADTDAAQLLLTLINLRLVVASLEATLLDELSYESINELWDKKRTYLGLILREAVNLLLQMLNLLLLLLIDLDLPLQVQLAVTLLRVHLVNARLQRFLVFLTLGQLDLYVAQTLLEFFDLCESDTQLVYRLGRVHDVWVLHLADLRRELRGALQLIKSDQVSLTMDVVAARTYRFGEWSLSFHLNFKLNENFIF